jgi:hypothetical protein
MAVRSGRFFLTVLVKISMETFSLRFGLSIAKNFLS